MMDPESQTTYELWDKPTTPRPPRSRLYSLEPIGLGTPQVESLTSYLRRLAVAHSVSVTPLILHEVSPRLRKARTKSAFFGTGSSTLHSTSSLAKESIWVLQRLTGQLDLAFLTFLPWADVAFFEGGLRIYRAWCSACLEEQRRAGSEVAEPLMWAVKPIRICAKHQQWLQDVCPYCHRALPWLMAYSRTGYCCYCRAWLGIVPDPRSLDLSDMGEGEIHWQHWLVDAVGNLLAAGPTLVDLPRLDCLAAGLAGYCAQIASGQIDQFAEILGAHQLDILPQRLKYWLYGKKHPPLLSLLELCYCLGTDPLSLLTEEMTVRDLPPLRSLEFERPQPKPKQPPPDREYLVQALKAILASNEDPPPSLNQIAKRLGCSGPLYLSVHWPEPSAIIMERYRVYVQAQKAQRLQALREEARQATFEIYAQGRNPTLGELGKHLKPGRIMDHTVQAAWKEAIQELGLPD
jgi:hypothetical protein